jgi:6-phosphogluconolactonase (cycloisomerase 2 family)
MAVIAAGVALWVTSPGASSQNFVVTNDNLIQGNNAGTVWKLSAGATPSLSAISKLSTGATNEGTGGLGMNETAIARHGSDVCVFISDNESGDIASFLAPSYKEVGRFILPGIVNSNPGLGLAARNDFLFANYYDTSDGAVYIAVWRIKSGCVLDLAGKYEPGGNVWGMAISPDGKTLVVSYEGPQGTVDSFSVGSDGSLTEHGPYDYYYLYLDATGVDITADGKYAVIAEIGYGEPPDDKAYTKVGIYPINSDGSLGEDIDFGGNGYLGLGVYSAWVRLSPDERFLYVSTNGTFSLTTLTFDESTPSVGFSCIVKMPTAPKGITTVLPSGAGGYLAVTASGPPVGGTVGLFTINPSTGCLTQAPTSPYDLGSNSIVSSVVPWPPRPF